MYLSSNINHYAGIGSRLTPANILHDMTHIASQLQSDGMILRSGAARGADLAFQRGATTHQIYISGARSNGVVSNGADVIDVCTLHNFDEAMYIAKQYHPKFNTLSLYVKSLMARNVYIILGTELDLPVCFVVCWTTDGSQGVTTADTGGTGQAIRLAHDIDIPIINLGNQHGSQLNITT